MRTQQRCTILFLVLSLVLTCVWATGCGGVQSRPWPTREAAPDPGKPVSAESGAQPTAKSAAPAPATRVPRTEPAAETPTGQPTVTETGLPTATEPAGEPTAEATATAPPPSTASAQPPPEAPAPALTLPEIVASLEGLPLDEFFEESYKQLLLRNPEVLTQLGIAEAYGLRNDRLNDLSDAYLRETQALEVAILDLLRTYDRAALPPEQQISYDVYVWYLDDRVRGHAFMYHNYPVHHFLGSYDDELIRTLTEIHPLATRQDVEDYVSRLAQVDDQVGQLMEGLKLREEAGVIPPKFIVQWTLPNLRRIADSGARSTPFYTAFQVKIGALEELSEADRQAFLEAAATEIDGSVIPAFEMLVEYFEYLQTVATDDPGAWKLPDGGSYYAYVLRRETSTDLTPAEVHERGLAEVARIRAEMRQVFDELGYPQDEDLGQLLGRAIEEGGFYNVGTQAGVDQVIAAYEGLLEEVEGRLDEVVDVRPKMGLEIVGEPGFSGGGYYVLPSRDGSRPGAFHTGVGGSQVPKFSMATVAYHEAIPGHHFQVALASELDLPTFRRDLFFNGYGEGWALYAERLCWELGLFDDDPYGNLGRLQLELLRAVRLVVDTGIHDQRWTREEARAYMVEALADPSGRWSHEVERYIVAPGQATGYKVGMLKILELRQKAMDALGDRFDLKEFHNIVVGNGGMPLGVLERLIQDYIEAKKEA
jgi:uncharacterized protein (DUF885 family)